MSSIQGKVCLRHGSEGANDSPKAFFQIIHCRSLSLNDLDCGRATVDTPHPRAHHSSPTSASDQSYVAITQLIYPLSPCYPPMARSTTPPGLPSFRTREAQELRLIPPGHLERIGQLLQRLFKSSPVTREATQDPPAEALRRTMGYNIPTATPSRPDRVSLPRGVRRGSGTGALAIAADGSQVRGRWGNRASGHGVGNRTIDIHPLARVEKVSTPYQYPWEAVPAVPSVREPSGHDVAERVEQTETEQTEVGKSGFTLCCCLVRK